MSENTIKKFGIPKVIHMFWFGKSAESIYEFLVYDLIDLGLVYYIKRLVKKIHR